MTYPLKLKLSKLSNPKLSVRPLKPPRRSRRTCSAQCDASNIEGARPFDQLTLSDIDKAEPRIAKTVETMVKKGKWTVEGYSEKFGNLSVM
ncbi:hypothetical protein PSTT_14197 [Puccinia striiformis]|uniref:Uncharacterized protein n=1 Tax=Puccinia striiformis TaxID=27350 RepID=A0A2S4UNI2_9BASI|nr:hypothetical protein PSTT_14197 [Puccinia striiformis]